MGLRANYAIREGGVTRVYYSHWGAQTIAEDIYWGPEATEAFIRANEHDPSWMDSVWSEGGVALNKDRKLMVYQYSEWPDEVDLERIYQEVLAETWKAEGWVITQARDWGDVAEAVGVPREQVMAQIEAPELFELEQVGDEDEPECLISIQTEDGFFDYGTNADLAGLLMNGPAVIEAIQHLPAWDESEAEGAEDRVGAVVHLNLIEPSMQLMILDNNPGDIVPFLEPLWPGYRITQPRFRLTDHFLLAGRAIPEALAPQKRSREECLRLIREQIGSAEQRKDDTIAFFRDAIAKMEAEQGPMEVSPSANRRTPSSRPSQWRQLLDRLQHK